MPKIFIIFVFSAIFLSFSTGQNIGGSYCSFASRLKLRICQVPLATFITNLEKETASELNGTQSALPILKKDKFIEVCKLFGEFENCSKPYMEDCSSDMSVVVYKSMYGYICNEGYDIYLRNGECFYETEKSPIVKKCKETFLEKTHKLKSDPSLFKQEKIDQTCSNMNEFLSCAHTSMEEQCGLEAWKLVHKMVKDLFEGLMHNCRINELNQED
uniref:DUF19 domain-containing protein n=1 Tax=Panagrolaimus sp. JU765 TaxID=591449 RepID=A0AC34QIK7_9BILA